MNKRADVYGYVNGEAVFSRDEFVYKARGFGEILSDRFLLEFAEKVTHGWYHAGWHQTFETFYLSDYACGEPRQSLTEAEFNRLKELQAEARRKAEEADEAREWRYKETIYWADNSVEEVWVDKDGVEKKVMVTGAHGDAC